MRVQQRTWTAVFIYSLASLLAFHSLHAAPEEDPKACKVKSDLNVAPKIDSALKCSEADSNSAASFVRQKVTLMKIANSKADFKNLAQYNRELEVFLNSCTVSGGKLTKEDLQTMVCDTDCTVQRASVGLFAISELPYLSSNSGSGQPADDAAFDQADRGLKIINSALSRLMRGDRGGAQTGKGEKYSSSFNQFLRDNGRLMALKSRLLLAIGDYYYKKSSRTRAAVLVKKSQDALSLSGATGPKPGEETHYAETFYREASWTLQEALIDVPQIDEVADPSPSSDPSEDEPQSTLKVSFSRLRQELSSLKTDTESRLHSVKNGFLFLNIDPEAFSVLSAADLQTELKSQLQEIRDVESRIEQIVMNWQDKKTDEQRRQIDAQNMRDERTLELKGMQIASYEDLAGEITQKFESLIKTNGYDTAMEDAKVEMYEKQGLLSSLSFELQRLTKETSAQINQIAKQTEIDLTVLAKEGHQEQRDHYKWLIDATLTTLNLNLQINEYRAQVTDYENKIKIARTKQDGLRSTIGSRTSLKYAEDEKIHEADFSLEKISEQETKIKEAQILPIKMRICALGVEYKKIVTGSPNMGKSGCSVENVELSSQKHWDEVLKLRQKYFGDDGTQGTYETAYKKLYDCMSPTGPCGDNGDKGLQTAVNEVFAEKIKQLYGSVTMVNGVPQVPEGEPTAGLGKEIVDMQTKLDDMISALKTAKNTVHDMKAAYIGINAGLGATYVALAGKIASLVPSFDLGEQAKAVYMLAMSSLEKGTDMVQTDAQYENEIKSFELEKATLIKELDQLKSQLKIDEVAKRQALAEIVGRGLELEKDHILVQVDASYGILEAKFNVEQVKAEGKRLQAEIDGLNAEIDQIEAETGLLIYEKKILNAQKEGSRNQKDSLQYEIDSINADIKGLDQEIGGYEALKKNAESQQSLVETTRDKVDDLDEEVALQQSIVNDLLGQQKSQITALSQDQIASVKDVLALEDTRIQQAKSFVETSINSSLAKMDLITQGSALTTQLNGQLTTIFDKVKAARCEMLQFAADRPAPGEQSTKLFIASEEIIANLTQGIPEYIRAKRSRLEYVNYLYNLYRNRISLLSKVVGTDLSSQYNYINDSNSLLLAMKDICKASDSPTGTPWTCDVTSLLFSDKQVPVHAAEFVIPAESGFMSRLLSKGSVRFELTPDAFRGLPDVPEQKVVEDRLSEKGYFQLWDSGFGYYHNLSVMNIALMSNLGTQCRDQVTLHINHLGYGARFYPVSAGNGADIYSELYVTAPRHSNTYVWDSTSEPNIYYDNYRDLGGVYTIGNLPETRRMRPDSDVKEQLRFLGAPLAGTYEISIDPVSDKGFDPKVAACLQGRALNIGVAYTKSLGK